MSAVRLAMHYSVALAPDEIEEIRERVRDKGPGFHDVPGLVAKVFLLGHDGPSYTLFYIWENPEAMLAFLEGERFAALVERFGRPQVDCFFTEADGFPFAEGEKLAIRPGPMLKDPAHGKDLSLVTARDGTYEVLYVATSAAA